MKTQRVLENFLHSRKALNRKPKTIQWYKELLARFANSYPDLPTEPEDVEQFLAGLPHSKVTQHAYYRALKALYRFAKKRYDFANPFQKIDSFPNPYSKTRNPQRGTRNPKHVTHDTHFPHSAFRLPNSEYGA